jgi:predicted DNA-binding transcriptional regulator AlpA
MNQGKYLRAKECAEYLNIARSTFWRWVKLGIIPPGIRLSNRCTVWKLSVLEAFVAAREGKKQDG